MSEESKSWYKMIRPLFNSGYEDDEFWAYGQDGFNEVLDSFVGSDVEIYDKSVAKTPKAVRAIIQNVTGDAQSSTLVRQILCNIGVLHCGQYIKANGAWWMVNSLPDNNRIYEKAVLWKCKYTIHFVSPLTGKIVDYPVYCLNSTQYGTGERPKTNMTVGDAQHLVYVPMNEETVLCDTSLRIIMDRNRANPTVFRVTQVDATSYAVGDEYADDGILQWSVIETQFNEATDSKENMVADFVKAEQSDGSSGDADAYTLRLIDSDGDNLLAVGESKNIEIVFKNAVGVDADISVLNVELVSGTDAIESFDVLGRKIILDAKPDKANVGETVVVRVSNEAQGIKAEIKIEIVNM